MISRLPTVQEGAQDGLEPATFGATIRRLLFLSVAVGCINGLDKLFSLLGVTCGFSVLRSEWCQKWCQHLRYPACRIFTHASHILRWGVDSRDKPKPASPPPRQRYTRCRIRSS